MILSIGIAKLNVGHQGRLMKFFYLSDQVLLQV